MGVVRRIRLRTRPALASGVPCLMPAGMAVFGERSSSAQQRAGEQIGRLQVLTRQVMGLDSRDAHLAAMARDLGEIAGSFRYRAGRRRGVTRVATSPGPCRRCGPAGAGACG
ncbi:hypothetical protein Asi03nite_33450 [Actinoplanes siamensis]|uniref:Uncharacterized protein n=1 Tax=Actinoplanes siamensis TaxID=1223317 RepID=A0A919N7L0_9ACTN|nr:hypothetical protein Asi03nite_33450 [Actinoplanes siamensis]